MAYQLNAMLAKRGSKTDGTRAVSEHFILSTSTVDARLLMADIGARYPHATTEAEDYALLHPEEALELLGVYESQIDDNTYTGPNGLKDDVGTMIVHARAGCALIISLD